MLTICCDTSCPACGGGLSCTLYDTVAGEGGKYIVFCLDLADCIANSGCNRPGASGSLSDQNAPVSVGTGPKYYCSFVLPPLVPCMISIGAASCSLAQTSPLQYRCPLSCSLFCIGTTCGGPCSSPDYYTPTWFGLRPLVQSPL